MSLASGPHPPMLLGCAQAIDQALTQAAEVDPLFLATPDKAAALLRQLTVLQGRLAELLLRVEAAAGEVAEAVGARDVAAWLAAETRSDLSETRADLALAQALERRYPVLRTALRDGLVSLPQARVIARALDELPSDLDPEVRARAEKTLITEADAFTPTELRRLGRRILDVLDPATAEAQEAKRLAAEEAHAQAKTKLTLKQLGDGTTRISGLIPDSSAFRLRTYLEAFTNPRHPTQEDAGATKRDPSQDAYPGSYPRRLGQAFCHLLEVVDPKRLPLHGGDATTILVTIGLDQLRADLGVGTLLGGDKLSAGEVRRLACTAKLVPAVLDGKSDLLDLGRSARIFEPPQRKAMNLRDRHCRAQGCTIPGTWCEAHHWTPWSEGGRTDLKDGALLCPHHHHRVHDPAYTAERLANGDVRFRRRN